MLKVAINAAALRGPLTGIGQYVLQLGQALKKEPGIEADFFYGYRFSDEAKPDPPPLRGRMRSLVRNYVPAAYQIRRFLEELRFGAGMKRKKYDLYHEPNYLALRFDGPLVLTVHDLSWIRYPETHPVTRVRAMERYFEPSLRKASLLLTDSEFVKREIIEVFGVQPSMIRAVPLGVDGVFRPMDAAQTRPALEGHGLVHGSYFLCVGTLEPRKNVQATVAAYAALPQEVRSRHPLVMAGMKGWRTSALEQVLEPLVRSGEARVLGYLERAELAAVTAGALAMVYPSVYEGFGLPPLEAMTCGVPAITSNVSSLPEVVGDSGLLVDPRDIDGLAAAMLTMASDAALRSGLSRKALERASQFSWDRCAAETAEAYRAAVANSR